MRFLGVCKVLLVVVCGALMYATMTVSATAETPSVVFKKVELAERATPLLQAKTTSVATNSAAISTLKAQVETEVAKAKAAAFGSFFHTTKQIYQEILDLQPNCPHMTVK